MTRPPVALSCGEPAGIGPEIAVKAWEALSGEVDFFWIGHPNHLPKGTAWQAISAPENAIGAASLPVLVQEFPGNTKPGEPDTADAQSVVDTIARGVSLVMDGEASALCTAPIHKKALQVGAGFAFPGHTEFLGHLAQVPRSVMMLASPLLRVVPVTIHVPICAVPTELTQELLEDTLRITHDGLRDRFGITAPRIAVAGLNPHASEGGHIGDEDLTLVAPVLKRLRSEGLNITGPLPADTMFHAPARARYDVAVCMYHDQALIPIKTLDFDGGVNVTLGLPFLRTSPDHGTAFDIAGQGIANPASLIAALRLAAEAA
ncbi:MAG: 4-hydroxythreonine-4-phosphate dehydrogenase PdxA [Marinovum sp.]|nr:4-hydroxythreonine-4-phosphate dehydrogenase PdxA [Marinovum sp.]